MIDVGDVIVYKSYLHWPDEKLVVHRVSEIKYDSMGNKILETKGDKNEYPDQEGPHIPEPYIREEHIMGKTLSIGDIPLKIPFVGYIGIWVNDGIKILSEPTSSKESASYAGIFAPMTITSVALIALIIVIPEKTKTIKQKIKKFRFGPRQTDLGKTLLLFLVVYFIFFTMIHTFAFDSVTASVGVEGSSPDSAVNFGRIKKGTESMPQDLPLINPSISTVKGVVFGKGDLQEYASRQVFELSPGETQVSNIQATATNSSRNGSFLGEIAVYSSPFWVMFPDDFMQDIIIWNPELSVSIFDLLSALILTTFTAVLLIAITQISGIYFILSTDYSWRFVTRPILSKKNIERIAKSKNNFKKALGKKIAWIFKTDIAEPENAEMPVKYFIKPIIASMVVLPILYLVGDQLTSMIIAVIIAGVFAYFISCKLRRKIILTALITIIIVICHMMIQSNLIILEKEQEMIVTLAYSFGVIGIYLLIFGLLIIPLSLISWAIVQRIRNLKERKDPLLMLEGKCDL